MALKLKSSILFNLLFMFLINSTFSFQEISIPSCGYDLLHEDHSEILFTDGMQGVYSFNAKDKDVENIVERNKLVISMNSFDNDILLIYAKPGVINLAIINDGIREEIIYSLPFRKGSFCYPAVDPLNKKVALIEKNFSTDKTDLIIMNILNRSKRSVAQLDIEMPVFAWNSNGEKLYYFSRTNGNSGFYLWDEKTGEKMIVKEVRSMSILYLYPRLINERYILFLGEDDNGTQILGKLDIDSLRTNSREIESKDYTMIMSIAFTPDNRFIYETTRRPFQKKENRVYISDINLNSRLILKDHSEYLIPIGYNKVLDGFVFFRNEKEIISINLNDPNEQKILYTVPRKKP